MKAKDFDVDCFWRVDSELLSLERVERDNLYPTAPINTWLIVAFGEGDYCYFSDLTEAKKAIGVLIDDKIKALSNRKEAISLATE